MKSLLLITLTALIAASPSLAKTSPANLKWMAGPPGLPDGSTFAVVSGDPGKKGMFTIRAKFPADYAVPAHWHPTNEKVTVLSGKVGYGMTGKLDKAKAKMAGAGRTVVMKAKMNHWVFASGGPAEISVSGMGPFQITYVNPADDPRKK